MNATASNLVSMNTGKIYKEIEDYLTHISHKNKGTSNKYRTGIERFFMIVKEKPLQFLTEEDVQLKYKDFQYFVNRIKEYKDEKGNSLGNKTINNHLSAITELIRHFYKIEIVEDIRCVSSLNDIRLSENNKNSYDPLTVEEVYNLVDWIKENETDRPDMKSYFMLLSLDTCLRKGAVLSLKWSDFVVIDNEVIIKAIDKNDKEYNGAISLEFYNQILTLKDKYNTDKVFPIGSTTINNVFVRWRDTRNFQGRRICIHSVRKCGGTYQFRLTSDILQAKKVLGHKNSSTTELYLGLENYGAVGAVSSAGKVNSDLYKDESVSKEDLIKAIENIKGYKTLVSIELQKILSQKGK